MTAQADGLRARVTAVTHHALSRGALQPIDTESEYLHDGGVDFVVRRALKASMKAPAAPRARRADPFLPYEQDLYVTELSDTHVALLNKYNVFDDHLLVITKAYVDQRQWLTPADFEALRVAMAGFDAMGFYNAGATAGASQPHKHLQVVPLPLAAAGPAIPIAPLLESATEVPGGGIRGRLPFVHGLRRLDPQWVNAPGDGARELLKAYHALLYQVGLIDTPDAGDGRQTGPYNLIVCREWMLLVPRRRETCYGITINALGIAGALLVWNEAQMRLLREHGPMAALKYVCLPRP